MRLTEFVSNHGASNGTHSQTAGRTKKQATLAALVLLLLIFLLVAVAIFAVAARLLAAIARRGIAAWG